MRVRLPVFLAMERLGNSDAAAAECGLLMTGPQALHPGHRFGPAN